ncbi:MarR family winged helix-turn-helix transcriptional regulator [Arthrobacter sp. SD76]|uniref:MarR family winged helix-turn-helix transcriptional regulator n=1 Tax=Arthrobacter sp. SD76 TaxID=3415007 RepID=UPI003C785E0B
MVQAEFTPKTASQVEADIAEPHVGSLIRRAQQLHLATWARIVSTEITSAQYSILAALDRLGDCSQRELCDEVDLDRSTMTALVSRMEKSALISRARSNGDARRNVVTLTDRGQAERLRLAPLVVQVQHELTASLDPDDVTALLRSLQHMLNHTTAPPRQKHA